MPWFLGRGERHFSSRVQFVLFLDCLVTKASSCSFSDLIIFSSTLFSIECLQKLILFYSPSHLKSPSLKQNAG